MVQFVYGLGCSCGVWCMNVDWIVGYVVVMVVGGVGVIRVVSVVEWLDSDGECMVVVVLVMR